MYSRRSFLRHVVWAPPVLLLAGACVGPVTGVTAQLDYDKRVTLGGTMTFRITAESILDAPNPDAESNSTTDAEMFVVVSPGLTALDPAWKSRRLTTGSIEHSQKVTFRARVPQTFLFPVRLDAAGQQQIRATAAITMVGGGWSGCA